MTTPPTSTATDLDALLRAYEAHRATVAATMTAHQEAGAADRRRLVELHRHQNDASNCWHEARARVTAARATGDPAEVEIATAAEARTYQEFVAASDVAIAEGLAIVAAGNTRLDTLMHQIAAKDAAWSAVLDAFGAPAAPRA